jgi:shikimate dehydrogenase
VQEEVTRLGVLGWPVAHSRSPAMHNAALAALGMTGWRYQRLPVPPALFAEVVRALAGSGFHGANVTVPHKRAALALADRSSEDAREIAAANTLSFARDGAVIADNTDAAGLLAALPVSARGLRAQVLGAGGSARAAVWALRREGASEVLVWNRTPQRARELAGELGGRAVATPQPADLLVNCTSVGLAVADSSRNAKTRRHDPAVVKPSATDAAALNQLGLTFDQVGEYHYVVDLPYGDGPTALLRAARAQRVRAIDGLDVLVAQGALSLQLWTGRQAPLEVMRRAARDLAADD